MICVNDNIPLEYKRNVIEFWKSSNSVKTRLLKCVKHRFRKIASLYYLRRWEKQVDKGGNRKKCKN